MSGPASGDDPTRRRAECEVWWARPAGAGRLLHLLPAADLERAGRFWLQADRDRSVAAAALTRLLLAGRLGVGPAELVIDRTRGKPRLSWPAAAVDFSVSHAGDQVAVAISEVTAVGIDVERLGRLSADPAQDAALTRRWVRQEAIVKLAGTAPAGAAACTLADLHPARGYLAALAVRGAGAGVTEHDGNTLLTERAGRA